MEPATSSGPYLSLFERQRITSWHDLVVSIREIARHVRRSPSTVSRELRPNIRGWDEGYEPVIAHLRASERAKRANNGDLESFRWLTREIQGNLFQHWSHEQIHLHLPRLHSEDPTRTVCVEAIYHDPYQPTEGDLSRSLTRKLSTGRALRRRQRRIDRRPPRFTAAMRTIHQRGKVVLDRQQPGHWEGALTVGSRNQSAIRTLVERTNRLTVLVHVPDVNTAGTVTAGIVQAMRQVPRPMRRSFTWYRGTEMADYGAMIQATGLSIYICDPASSWQRATSENTNGLLRQYFPKGTNLSVHSPADLRRVQRKLNNRSRKSLSGRTPAEVFASLTAESSPDHCDDR